MTCEACRRVLRACVDGEARAREVVRVWAHVRGCADCAAKLASVRGLVAGMGAPDTAEGAAPVRRGRVRGAARLVAEVAIALAVGVGAFEATEAVLAPHERAAQSALTARAVDLSPRPANVVRARDEDLGPQLGPG